MADVTNETIRETYEAPTVEDIPLHAEERMLTGCKSTTPGNGFNSFPGNCVVHACVGFHAS